MNVSLRSSGHMSDPHEIPGLAHFCEHMLFLGTEKFPDENGYSSFLSKNGGSSNAATYVNCGNSQIPIQIPASIISSFSTYLARRH